MRKEHQSHCATFLFLPHSDFDLSLNRRTFKILLFQGTASSKLRLYATDRILNAD